MAVVLTIVLGVTQFFYQVTNSGKRESQPFREEPETLVFILVSTLTIFSTLSTAGMFTATTDLASSTH